MAVLPGARLMQVQEWGYPLGVKRPVPPANRAFSVIHITGNSRLPSAEGEATWRINDMSLQNSATFFVNRDGSIVQALSDPLHMDPWSNGDANEPDLKNDRIAWWNQHRGYYNANELTLLSIENVGFEPGASLTQAQVESCARIIRHYHRAAGVPITRETVIGHYQLNSVTRPNCPGRDKSVIDEIVSLARGEGGETAEEDPQVIEELRQKVAYWKGMAERRGERIANLQAALAEQTEAEADLAKAEAKIGELTEDNADLTAHLNRARRRVADIKAKVAALATDVSDD